MISILSLFEYFMLIFFQQDISDSKKSLQNRDLNVSRN